MTIIGNQFYSILLMILTVCLISRFVFFQLFILFCYSEGGVVTYKDRKIRPRIILLSDGKITDQRIFNGPDFITKQGHNKTEVNET